MKEKLHGLTHLLLGQAHLFLLSFVENQKIFSPLDLS